MRLSRTHKGQVSIFLIFLFQVLFVFFAMIVNVGLLVYYKINLQNSVDIAAYYAGMKQSEMLNTIGHVNYQIRQSWKLLAYRNLILGTLGPDNHEARPLDADSNRTNFKPDPGELIYGDPNTGEPKLPVFCITIAEIFGSQIGNNGNNINKTDNQCKRDEDYKLSGFKIPPVIFAMPAINQALRQGAIDLQDKYLSEFGSGGERNYLTLAAFIILNRADSLNRKKVISVLANTLSTSSEDFKDLSGASVYEGATTVLRKNLAEQNQVSVTASLFNSLGHTNCGGANPDIEKLPGWLSDVNSFASFFYMDSIVDNPNANAERDAAQAVVQIGKENYASIPRLVRQTGGQTLEQFKALDDLITTTGVPNHVAGPWTTTLGVEKNPWCMPYVGLKAETQPRLPFMPSGLIPKLVAKSFVKPFGSSIGPWYGRSWPDTTINSTSDKNVQSVTDTIAPFRQYQGEGLPSSVSVKDQIRYFPNFSRFPGDRLGLLSRSARWAYGKYYWKKRPPNPYWVDMWRKPLAEAATKNSAPNSPFFMGPSSGDIMADPYFQDAFKGNEADGRRYAKEMRISELAAIAPDLYDISYYPIEPRFNEWVLPKLQGFIEKNDTKNPALLVRGDLGWRHPDFRRDPGIADDSANIDMQIQQFKSHEFYSKTATQIFQTITDYEQVLTSWAETNIVDYEPGASTSKIGHCNSKVDKDANPWTPGSCTLGGRTGYSVKLVSKKFLTNSIPNIGGEGVSGVIINTPPENF